MGLKDKLKNRQNSNTPETNALDLCDVSINAIFNRCLASSRTLPSDIERTYLYAFYLDPNFVDPYKPVDFDKPKLEENFKKIQFMFGQLSVVHKKESPLTPYNSSKKYNGFNWTREKISLMQLCYLAIASRLLVPFIPETNSATILFSYVTPTLSPNDPNFPAWWAEHKAEWADPE